MAQPGKSDRITREYLERARATLRELTVDEMLELLGDLVDELEHGRGVSRWEISLALEEHGR